MEDKRKNDSVVKEKLNTLISLTKDIHEVIHGNGNPEKGLVVRHARVEEVQKTHVDKFRVMWSFMVSISIIIIAGLIKIGFF